MAVYEMSNSALARYLSDTVNEYSDNDTFLYLSQAQMNAKHQRQKGWYICPTCGEYIKAIGRKESPCPFCGRINERMQILDSVMEQTVHAIWRDCGTYSDLRADRVGVC